MKIIIEICNKYDGTKEFVDNRIKELCAQDGILINEVRTWFKLIYFCFKTKFPNAVMRIVRLTSSFFLLF